MAGTSGSNTAEFALAEAWNGRAWTRTSVQPPASARDDTDLIGVSCTAVKNCVAVGVGDDGAHGGLTSFAELWNGTTWSSAGKISWPKGTSHPYLVAVSCRSAKRCVAVGFIDADLADGGHTGKAAATSWNGNAWTATAVPGPWQGQGEPVQRGELPGRGRLRGGRPAGAVQLGQGQRPGRPLGRYELEAGNDAVVGATP